MAAVYEPEPAVVWAAAAGDIRAFEELVRGLQPEVWRFLRHLVGDAALAEDVTQETFLRVHQRLDSFSYRSKFSTWVFQIARNAGVDAMRARTRRDTVIRQLRAPAPPHPSPAASSELAEGLQALSPKLREALLVVEVLGLGYREASGLLGVPEGTVKSRVAKARTDLIAWLTAAESADEV